MMLRKPLGLTILGLTLLIIGLVGVTYGQTLSWSGERLRIQSSDIKVRHGAQSSFVVGVANPTLQTVTVRVEPGCGCTQITQFDKELGPLAISRWVVTADYDGVRRRPFGRAALDVKCSSSSGQWTEQILVEAIK